MDWTVVALAQFGAGMLTLFFALSLLNARASERLKVALIAFSFLAWPVVLAGCGVLAAAGRRFGGSPYEPRPNGGWPEAELLGQVARGLDVLAITCLQQYRRAGPGRLSRPTPGAE